MFYDLNLIQHPTSRNSGKELTQIITKSKQLGYGGIAVNRFVTGKLTPEHANTFVPINVEDTTPILPNLRFGSQPFKQFSRLTVLIDDQAQFNTLTPTSPIIGSYDIFAVQPTSEKLFHQACQLEVDIIVLGGSNRQDFPLRVPTIKMALEKGIYFEISYSPGLDVSSSTRYFTSNALNLIRVTKGKNIIISSQAHSSNELRAPYDVCSLGVLYGLPFQGAQNALTSNCEAVIYHAYTRKTFKGVVSTEVNETQLNEKVGHKRKRKQ